MLLQELDQEEVDVDTLIIQRYLQHLLVLEMELFQISMLLMVLVVKEVIRVVIMMVKKEECV